MKLPIYMDHHATTPVDPRVLERMLPFFAESFGNAASRNHAFGWKAEEATEVAREEIGRLLGTGSREVVFTSGATEANNLALFGVAEVYADKGKHIITQATEHKAVLDPIRVLEKRGYAVTVLPVDAEGCVAPEAVAAALTKETILVSIMAVNNEIGTIQPLEEIGRICKDAGVILHTDAAQGAAVLSLDVEKLGVDLLAISGHKIYGPKGIGALYVRRRAPRVRLAPIIHGGGHERGLRSGTLNVPAVVGLGEACCLARQERPGRIAHLRELRDRLEGRLARELEGVFVHGHSQKRHPGNLNVSFDDVDGEALLMGIRNVAVSSGAACASATLEPSHVLSAIGVDDSRAHRAIRFGLGAPNTAEEVEYVAGLVIEKVEELRKR